MLLLGRCSGKSTYKKRTTDGLDYLFPELSGKKDMLRVRVRYELARHCGRSYRGRALPEAGDEPGLGRVK